MAKRKPSEAKAKVALEKPRVGGRFVSLDPEKAEKLKQKADDIQAAIAEQNTTGDIIAEEDREYFGTDSQKFFEIALKNSKTYYDGYKYAKELKNLQHPALSAVQSKQEMEVTTRVLRWDWEEDPTIEQQLVQIPVVNSLDTEHSTSDAVEEENA